MHDLTLESLYWLTSGKIPFVCLGTLEPNIARGIGAPLARHVLFSIETYEHIKNDHPDITDEEFLYMPRALSHGLAIFERARPQWVAFSFRVQPLDVERRYLLAVKGAGHGHNVYARSWRRMRQGQLRSLLKRGQIMRAHK